MKRAGKVSDSKSQKYSDGVVLAIFCVMRCINGPPYLERDREETKSET